MGLGSGSKAQGSNLDRNLWGKYKEQLSTRETDKELEALVSPVYKSIPGKVFSMKNFLKSQSPKLVILGSRVLAGMMTSLTLKSPWRIGFLRLWRWAIPFAMPDYKYLII